MTSWPTIVFTTLGAGATGAVVTTYGSQSRQRLQARSDARNAIRKADRSIADPARTPRLDFTGTVDDLDTAAMLAGLPKGLTELHREACERYWTLAIAHWSRTEAPQPIGAPPLAGSTDRQAAEVHEARRTAYSASALLANATWHPWASAPSRRYKTHQLAHALNGATPEHADQDPSAASSRTKART